MRYAKLTPFDKGKAMKFVTYLDRNNEELPGVVSATGDTVHSLKSLGHDCADLVDFIAGYDGTKAADIQAKIARAGGEPLSAVRLQAPIPHPRHDILCVGQNYVAHAIESAKYAGREWVRPDYPIIFTKRVDRAVGPDGEIPSHSDITAQLDYEVELALIIGRRCSKARPEDAFSHIFGYSVANDISARDIQHRHNQWILGKGMDGAAPFGPWIVTADEFAAPPHLAIRCRVNGELRQDSNTNDFIFDIPRLLSEISAGMTLEPGDILITGTPAGVGMGFQPPKFLRSGDVVECEIEKIGVLRNTIR